MVRDSQCGIFAIFERQCLFVEQKESKYFGPPKGHKLAKESYKQAAIREFYEETGLFICDFFENSGSAAKPADLTQKLTESEKYLNLPPLVFSKTTYYVVHVPKKIDCFPIDSDEISQCKWFDLKKLINFIVDNRPRLDKIRVSNTTIRFLKMLNSNEEIIDKK